MGRRMPEAVVRELKVQPIKNGTVIDHISAGQALQVMRILGLPAPGSTSIVSIGMNLPSSKMGQKDVVKIEDRELDPNEVNKISLIAPKATISIIRNFQIAKKAVVQLPKEIVGLARCENLSCITNTKQEPVRSRHLVAQRDPPKLLCAYCGREVRQVAASLVPE
jgi:aspartate carbamoyltransferase regulatory subunit